MVLVRYTAIVASLAATAGAVGLRDSVINELLALMDDLQPPDSTQTLASCAQLLDAFPHNLMVMRAGLVWCPIAKDATTSMIDVIQTAMSQNASLVAPSSLLSAYPISDPAFGGTPSDVLPRIIKLVKKDKLGWTPSKLLSLREGGQLSTQDRVSWCSAYAASYTSFAIVRNPCAPFCGIDSFTCLDLLTKTMRLGPKSPLESRSVP